jgi:hypothetical protein
VPLAKRPPDSGLEGREDPTRDARVLRGGAPPAYGPAVASGEPDPLTRPERTPTECTPHEGRPVAETRERLDQDEKTEEPIRALAPEDVQNAHREVEQVGARLALTREPRQDLDQLAGDPIPPEVGHERLERADEGGAVEARESCTRPIHELDLDQGQDLERPGETSARAPGPLCDRGDPTQLLRIQVDDAVGLCLIERSQDQRSGAVLGHPWIVALDPRHNKGPPRRRIERAGTPT